MLTATNYQTSKDFELSEFSAGEWLALKYVGFDAKNLEIPAEIDGKKITHISSYFFEGNNTIENIKIANGIKSIGSRAFASCENLKSVILPETLERIDDSVFSDSGIEELHLPNSVNEIGCNLCYGCKKLNKVVLSDSLTEIPIYAFHNCKELKYVTLPKKIKEIKRNAFSNCKIKYIDFPEGLEIIEESAFYQNEFEKIIFPKSIKSIEKESINSTTLKTVIILPGCEASLGDSIFTKGKYWSNLTSVCIPASVTKIAQVFSEEAANYHERIKRDEDGKIVRDAWGKEVTELVGRNAGFRVNVSEKLTVYCESGSEIMSLAKRDKIKCSDYSTYLSANLDSIRKEIEFYVGSASIPASAQAIINIINDSINYVRGIATVFLNRFKNK